MRLACFCCGGLFDYHGKDEDADRLVFCGEDCKAIFKEWVSAYDQISLTRYYLLRKHTKTLNEKDVLT
jgi:hypothetical protein